MAGCDEAPLLPSSRYRGLCQLQGQQYLSHMCQAVFPPRQRTPTYLAAMCSFHINLQSFLDMLYHSCECNFHQIANER